MKFLTDENVATSVLYALRKGGFQVKDVKEENMQGATDKEILRLAFRENRIIITHDKDFANVASSNILHKGIILLRFRNQNPRNVVETLTKVLQSYIEEKIQDNLTVISETQVVIHLSKK